MRNLSVITIVLSLVMLSITALAAEGGKKGASPTAYERASEHAIFHRVSDWFATRGKSPEEKAMILEERKAKRAAKRSEKEAGKAQGKTKKAQKKFK